MIKADDRSFTASRMDKVRVTLKLDDPLLPGTFIVLKRRNTGWILNMKDYHIFVTHVGKLGTMLSIASWFPLMRINLKQV